MLTLVLQMDTPRAAWSSVEEHPEEHSSVIDGPRTCLSLLFPCCIPGMTYRWIGVREGLLVLQPTVYFHLGIRLNAEELSHLVQCLARAVCVVASSLHRRNFECFMESRYRASQTYEGSVDTIPSCCSSPGNG